MAYNPGGSKRGSGDPRFGGNRGGGRDGGRRFGGGGGFGGGRGGDRDRRGPAQMHQATCGDCGKSCEVPFRPSGSKPVFCSDCFKSKGNDRGDNRNFERRDDRGGSRDFDRGDRGDRGGRRSYSDRDFSDRTEPQMHQTICSECGKTCEVPFKPSGDKPVYCSACFDMQKAERKGKSDAKGSAELNEKFEILNAKLDRIMKALDITLPAKETKEIKLPEEKVTVKKPEIKSISVIKKPKAKAKKAKA